MKRWFALPLLLTLAAAKPVETPAQVVERQLVAYNAHDADAFAATYAADAEVFKSSADGAVLRGREAIHASYAALFRARPTIVAEVSGRLTAGDFVTDHETIRGTEMRAIVVYQVKAGLIRRVWLFAPPNP